MKAVVKPVRVERVKPVRTPGKLSDFELGFALMRDRRVTIGSKALAVVVALAMVALGELLEVPIEEILIAMIPSIAGVCWRRAACGSRVHSRSSYPVELVDAIYSSCQSGEPN